MTGERGNDNRCPLCGGRLQDGVATIPFVLSGLVVIIKEVPAETCGSCHEPYLTGVVTDKVAQLLNQARALHAEVSVISYAEAQADPLLTPATVA